jgi:hypothetical protein
MSIHQQADHSNAYIAELRRRAPEEAESARARVLEAKEQRVAARKDLSARIDSRIRASWAWMLANPKPTVIGIAAALAFNFALYPLARPASDGNSCDYRRTSTAGCPLSH